MKDQFLPYELAAQLKELGFNLPTLGHYYERNGEQNLVVYGEFAPDTSKWIAAPLYQQAFEWFRTAKKFRSFRDCRLADIDKPNEFVFDYQIKRGNGLDTHPYFSGDFDTMAEAELGCIKKLIAFAKE